MNVRRLLPLGSLVLVLLSVGSPSAARDDRRPPARAEVLFAEGRRALVAEDYDTACAKFGASLRLDRAAGTLMNLATCEGKKGRIASAWRHWREAEKLLSVGDSRAAFIATQISALKPRLSYLTIRMNAGLPDGAIVSLDAVELARWTLGVATPIDPGRHEILVTAPRSNDKRYSVYVSQGDKAVLFVEAGKAEKTLPIATKERASVQATAASSGISRSTIGYAVGAVGAAAVAGAAITGLMMNRAASTVDANCDESRQCNQTGLDAAARGASLVVIYRVTGIAGLAGLGAGALLVLTDSKDEAPGDGVAVRALPGGARLTYRGTF